MGSETKRFYRLPLRINGLQLDEINVDTDAHLRQVAAVIESASKRSTDVVARYREDTFALLLPNTPQVAAAQLVDRIQEKIMAVLANAATASQQPLTLSKGVVGMVPKQGLSETDLLEAAEQSLND